MTVIVGKIQGFDVQYVPEKDIVFCKNTAISVKRLKAVIYDSSLERNYIEEKNLSVTKDNGSVQLGCLVTPMSNINTIYENIKKERKNFKVSK